MYNEIKEYSSDYCRLCTEYKAVCPRCSGTICVTCMDSCEFCGSELW